MQIKSSTWSPYLTFVPAIYLFTQFWYKLDLNVILRSEVELEWLLSHKGIWSKKISVFQTCPLHVLSVLGNMSEAGVVFFCWRIYLSSICSSLSWLTYPATVTNSKPTTCIWQCQWTSLSLLGLGKCNIFKYLRIFIATSKILSHNSRPG